MTLALDILLWFAALSAGLMAGLYFAFSAFVMTALASLDRAAGIAAMNAINRAIVRSAFLPVFLLSTAACLALAVIGVMQRGEPGAAEMALGGAVYVLGMTGVTMVRNVPLNDALAADHDTWERYLQRWTRWNHVRTLACFAALALFIRAIALYDR